MIIKTGFWIVLHHALTSLGFKRKNRQHLSRFQTTIQCDRLLGGGKSYGVTFLWSYIQLLHWIIAQLVV